MKIEIICLLLFVLVNTGKSLKQSEKKTKPISVYNDALDEFFQTRRPRYTTYTGHPTLSIAKRPISYHNTPAVTTYDAGFGTYGPSYTSLGGYATQPQDNSQNNHQETEIADDYVEDDQQLTEEQELLEDDDLIQDDETYEEYESFKINDNNVPEGSEQFSYTITTQEKPSDDDVNIEQPNQQQQQQNYHHQQPTSEPNHFIYTIQTQHPVYSPPPSYGWSYRISAPSSQDPNHQPQATYHSYYSTRPSYYLKQPQKSTSNQQKSQLPPNYHSSFSSHVSFNAPKQSYRSIKSSNFNDIPQTSQPKYLATYSVHVYIPWSRFSCENHYHPGFYADMDTQCSVWHYCQPDGRQDTFKCPKSTLFNQKTLTCDWWFNVDCPLSPRYYNINKQLYDLKILKKKRLNSTKSTSTKPKKTKPTTESD